MVLFTGGGTSSKGKKSTSKGTFTGGPILSYWRGASSKGKPLKSRLFSLLVDLATVYGRPNE